MSTAADSDFEFDAVPLDIRAMCLRLIIQGRSHHNSRSGRIRKCPETYCTFTAPRNDFIFCCLDPQCDNNDEFGLELGHNLGSQKDMLSHDHRMHQHHGYTKEPTGYQMRNDIREFSDIEELTRNYHLQMEKYINAGVFAIIVDEVEIEKNLLLDELDPLLDQFIASFQEAIFKSPARHKSPFSLNGFFASPESSTWLLQPRVLHCNRDDPGHPLHLSDVNSDTSKAPDIPDTSRPPPTRSSPHVHEAPRTSKTKNIVQDNRVNNSQITTSKNIPNQTFSFTNSIYIDTLHLGGDIAGLHKLRELIDGDSSLRGI
ncbi:hypothetical protein DFH27DRAFT_526723 [Peziza echinospora]|nr:hypothetical protein DFH27DRAFT_526723 [Peziza echinospora]